MVVWKGGFRGGTFDEFSYYFILFKGLVGPGP